MRYSADYEGLDFTTHEFTKQESMVNFKKANLFRSNGRNLKFDGSTFESANLSECNMQGADLSMCNFRNAKLNNINCIKAKLYSADFSDADLSKANLSGADLTRAYFSDSILNGTNFTDANLQNTVFRNVDLTQCIGLTEEQLANTKGDKRTILPKGFQKPPKWS